jgi:zinc protease
MSSLTHTGKIALVSLAIVTLAITNGAQAQVVQPPPPGPLRPYTFPKVEQFTLDNGLKVVVVEKHTLPVVEGRLMLDAGALREPANKNGLASLTGRLLT